MGKGYEQIFFQRRYIDSQPYRWLNITIREIKITTTMNYHFTPFRRAIRKQGKK